MQTSSLEQTTQTLTFPRFGEFTFDLAEAIAFPWGLPGFPAHKRWLAVTLPSQPNFVWLQSLDDLKVALPTCDPWMVFEHYNPRLPGYALAALEITDPGDFTLLCVMVAAKGGEEMRMNLLAPIVVNLKTRRARQVMLENSGFAVDEPLPRKVPSAAGDDDAAAQ